MLDFDEKRIYNNKSYIAEIAQLVEHFTRKEDIEISKSLTYK